MLSRSRRAIGTVLLAVWFVWSFVSLSAAIHFHVVEHSVDPVTAEVVHSYTPSCSLHHGHERPGGDHAAKMNEWHAQYDQDCAGERETCAFLSVAQHVSSVLPAPPSLGGSLRMALAPPIGPGVHGERDIALLALAPKLPPPHLL